MNTKKTEMPAVHRRMTHAELYAEGGFYWQDLFLTALRYTPEFPRERRVAPPITRPRRRTAS